ncbi:GNAT family N-acetyltransferase [Sphingobacterium sp. MYb382]|uniref:GNAT family N-acetyltransferase n=1 Tax=Sphingobacterium sp. MYb382 TaxID=2745278 RepID=UPI0030A14C2F
MIHLQQTKANSSDFAVLIDQLNLYLHSINGESDAFFKQHNQVDLNMLVIIAYADEKAVGCGAFKVINDQYVEIKRMFILPEYRKKGIASTLLVALEEWAKELGYQKARLETAKSMEDAVFLYRKNHYYEIPNFDQYIGVESSVCFEKNLAK